ncbi:MAG: hypothetical protein WCL04_01925 [Verrucomicrobiota bacterium]
MKTFKALTAGLLALSAATLASAQTKIRIVGSSAFRAATEAAIVNSLNGAQAAWTGNANLAKAARAVFTGTLSNVAGNPAVIIQCTWSGSTGGIQTVAQTSPVINSTSFLTENNSLTNVSVVVTPGNGLTSGSAAFTGGNLISSSVANAGNNETAQADIAMSDTAQSSTKFNGHVPFTATTLLGTFADYEDLSANDYVVGVITFQWVRGNITNSGGAGSTGIAGLTNVTTLQAQTLLSGGMPLSAFTGVTTDTASMNILGRDEDSGTRVVTFAESAYGVETTPTQYTVSLTSGQVTNFVPTPAVASLLGFKYDAGHSGYSSGGTLATNLSASVSSTLHTYFIGYAGVNDAASVTGGLLLKYNGEDCSDANVKSGKYTFWSYEHLMFRSGASATAQAAAFAIAKQINNTDAPASGVKVTDMTVGRFGEGLPVVSFNPFATPL